MKICIDCGCNMPDDHDGDICECCRDDRGDTVPDSGRLSKYELRRLELLQSNNPCFVSRCGWYDSDFGCTCPYGEEWYQCPLEPEPRPEDFLTVEEARERGLIP